MSSSKLTSGNPEHRPVTRSGDGPDHKPTVSKKLRISVKEIEMPKDTSPQIAQIFACK